MPGTSIKLIAGLGNPGAEYARTRHNAGFWFVDELMRRYGGAAGHAVLREERKHQAEMARVRIDAADVWLMKPLTYMNRSGGAVASVAQFYKIAPEEVLVAHDELDFAPGTVRLKQGGGHAGNNGVRDVIATLGEGFWRLRIGVGQPGVPREGIDYVLGRASAQDEQLIRETILEAADAVPVILAGGAQKAMNRLHARAPEAPDAD